MKVLSRNDQLFNQGTGARGQEDEVGSDTEPPPVQSDEEDVEPDMSLVGLQDSDESDSAVTWQHGT